MAGTWYILFLREARGMRAFTLRKKSTFRLGGAAVAVGAENGESTNLTN
jgi:hypothetical protein